MFSWMCYNFENKLLSEETEKSGNSGNKFNKKYYIISVRFHSSKAIV